MMVYDGDMRKASILKRVIARLVDILVAWALALFVPPVGIILGLVYLAVADGLPRGQSLGKMVFGLEVLMRDGDPCDLKSSVFRNLPFVLMFLLAAIPILGWILLVIAALPLILVEIWLVFVDDMGERLGDRIADTHVVEKLH